ncbi:MAG TPA: DUF4907 domain-containing protein [Bacteroidia bacterium]|nr:DUF4907 domain-containing protein [Bacteroidia bacterium]
MSIALCMACQSETSNTNAFSQTETATTEVNPALSVSSFVFNNDTMPDPSIKGFGFMIHVDEKPYIHQPNIPAVQGIKGFVSESEAQKVAVLMEHKIRNNIMPPSISVSELDSLHITY